MLIRIALYVESQYLDFKGFLKPDKKEVINDNN